MVIELNEMSKKFGLKVNLNYTKYHVDRYPYMVHGPWRKNYKSNKELWIELFWELQWRKNKQKTLKLEEMGRTYCKNRGHVEWRYGDHEGQMKSRQTMKKMIRNVAGRNWVRTAKNRPKKRKVICKNNP